MARARQELEDENDRLRDALEDVADILEDQGIVEGEDDAEDDDSPN